MNSFKKNIIRQIFITNDAENEHFSSLNNELKKKITLRQILSIDQVPLHLDIILRVLKVLIIYFHY